MRRYCVEEESEKESVGSHDVPGAQALLRGLDLLLAIGTAAQPLRFRDIEKTVDMSRATLHRLLAALLSRRLISYDQRTRCYQVGIRVLELSRRTLDQSAIIRAAKPELGRLARRLNRTVCVMVLDRHEVFVLDFEDADPSYGRLVRLWPRSPALETAAGRAIVAALPRERSEALVAEIGGADGSGDRFWAELGIAKALGYAVLPRESVSGRPGVAAAILDGLGYPIGAIACPFETDQISAEEQYEAGRIIAEGARRASGHIGMSYAAPTVLPRSANPVSDGVEILPTGRDFMGENPLWNQRRGRLYWVDVLAPALRWWDPAARASGRLELQHITAGIAFDDKGRIIAAGQYGVHLVDPDSGASTPLINPDADRPDNRFNTAAIDPQGRFWAGTMAVNHEPGKGRLYSIDHGLQAVRRIEPVQMPKNVAFDPAGTRMYLSDAVENAVFVFPFDGERCTLGERRLFVSGKDMPGQPNGITVDAEGHLWVTCLGGWCVRRYDPASKLSAEVTLPIPMPTNCAFGGEDLSTLYLTSTYIRLPPGMSAAAPASGQIMAVRTAVRGQPSAYFRERR
jgi:sugar lactone lactonase YvrE/DNA-binding IclR family transcriptional regulator